MTFKKTILICLHLVLIVDLHAQSTDTRASQDEFLSHWMASLYSDWGIASHLFARNMTENHGFGFGGELLYNIQDDKPLWGGIGVHSFAFDDERLPYSQEIDGVYYNYEDHTASRIFMLHGIIRFQPEVRFFLQPFLQAAAGVHWYFTNTKIEDTDYDEQVERINESRDAVLGFALHAGLQYVPKKLPDFRIDARFGYFRNASVEYLRYNPDLNGGSFPIDYFEPKVSAVDIFGIQVGITAVIRPHTELFE